MYSVDIYDYTTLVGHIQNCWTLDECALAMTRGPDLYYLNYFDVDEDGYYRAIEYALNQKKVMTGSADLLLKQMELELEENEALSSRHYDN